MKKLILCSLLAACCATSYAATPGAGSAGTTVKATTVIDYNAQTPTVAPLFVSTVKKGSDASIGDILVSTRVLAPSAGDTCVTATYSGANTSSNIGVSAAANADSKTDNVCFTSVNEGDPLYLNNYASGKINAGLTHITLNLTNKAA